MALTPEQKAAWEREKAERQLRMDQERAEKEKQLLDADQQIDQAIKSVEKKEKWVIKKKIIVAVLAAVIEAGIALWYFVFR